MDTKSLISSEFPVLSLEDSGEKALRIMNEYHVFHLPLIQRDNYLALVSEDDILDWDTPEQPLSLAEFLTFRPAVFEGAHPYEAVKLAKEFDLSVLPVVTKQNHYAGVITMEGLFSFMTDNHAIKLDGSVLVLEMEQRNYSLSEIARICESNDISIEHVMLKNNDEQGMLIVTIKVNTNDIKALVSTFERYNYNIIETFAAGFSKDNVQDNYNMLMHYMNI
jgi:predicted transcriptional regulator